MADATIDQVRTAVTNMLVSTYGNTLPWNVAKEALNLSIFDIKLASQGTMPNPAPPAGATVANGASVVVQDAAGAAQAGSPGAASVTGTTLNYVRLTV